jgi:hypothetical protein
MLRLVLRFGGETVDEALLARILAEVTPAPGAEVAGD